MHRLQLVGILTLAAALVSGGATATLDVSNERLLSLARLDGAIHYFHPVAATGPSGWDSAFARFAPIAVSTASRSTYVAAIDSMLMSLGDPATHRVVAMHLVWRSRWLADGVLVVDAAPGRPIDTLLTPHLLAARTVILDLRGVVAGVPERTLAQALLRGKVTVPGMRALRYAGLPKSSFGQLEESPYKARWRAVPAEVFRGHAAGDAAVTIVVDSQTVLPAVVLALRSVGRGSVLGVGTDGTTPAAATYRLSLDEGIAVNVRIAERVGMQQRLRTDTTIVRSSFTYEMAAAFARRSVVRLDVTAHSDTLGHVWLATPPMDRAWSADLPSVGYRILAAARLWSTIHYFFPHTGSIAPSWADAFRRLTPAIVNATDPLAYAKAIRSLAWWLHDSHAWVGGRALTREQIARAPLPLVGSFVHDTLVLTRVAKSAGSDTSVRVGDIVLSVDGVSVAELVRRRSLEIASGTPQGFRRELPSAILVGRTGSASVLTLLGADMRPRRVRIMPVRSALSAKREGPIVRILAGNVGYVDLERLAPGDIDAMFDTLRNTRAIVFDNRGYPQGAGWDIAARLSTRTSPVFAQARVPDVLSPDSTQNGFATVQLRLPRARGWRYEGRTVMLINERSMSHAEYTGQMFTTANGTTLIGSATVGADGNITDVLLPGGILVSFTGMDIRLADGRPTQRIGLQPSVRVEPTVRGIREGRDEVLEAALRLIGTS